MIFVNSMSDLFHESLPFDFIKSCFETMMKVNWHTYQVLTKRPSRMLQFTKMLDRIPDHIWLGTTVELPIYKSRIDLLRQVNVSVRFVSFEPLLGSLGKLDLRGISWTIVGGESGPRHRPVDPDWVGEIRDQCIEQNVSFFFKQWGGHSAAHLLTWFLKWFAAAWVMGVSLTILVEVIRLSTFLEGGGHSFQSNSY
jgi:protein gp37